MRTPLADRFWSKVNKNGPTMPHMRTNCWMWTGAVTSKGYGCIGVWMRDVGKMTIHHTHRVSWWLARRIWPEIFFICHHCDNRLCVRPEHLFIGTAEDNVNDMDRKGRRAVRIGENHPLHRLSKQNVSEIRGSSEGSRALSERFGVTRAHINDIRRGNGWRDAKGAVEVAVGLRARD